MTWVSYQHQMEYCIPNPNLSLVPFFQKLSEKVSCHPTAQVSAQHRENIP